MSDSISPAPFCIRDAALADLPTIVEFNRCLAHETEGKVLDEAILSAGVTRALADPARLRYWVAEVGSPGTVIGQAAVTEEWSDWRNGRLWWLQSVYVARPYRGFGVFRALYQHIHQEALSNADVIGLRLYVEDSDDRATHLSGVGYEAGRLLGVRGAVYRSLRST